MNNVAKIEENHFAVEEGKTAKAKIEISKGEHKLKVVLEENSTLEFIGATSNNSALSLEFDLIGENSSVEVITCSKAEKDNIQRIKTNVFHNAKNTRSIVRSRGASWDKGLIDLKGLAKVEKSARGAKSFVECKALLLGKDSKAHADPVLEILNNDVVCSHSASIAEIDKKQIFYLQTRGISEEEAKNLIVQGFLGQQ
jgi:Fe-S cluster assembly scaffold protein SufB